VLLILSLAYYSLGLTSLVLNTQYLACTLVLVIAIVILVCGLIVAHA
jgi:hypothetical protein